MRLRRRLAGAEAADLQSSRLHLICPSRRSGAGGENPIGAADLFEMSSVESNGRSWHVSTGATCSWLSPGFEFVEGLGGLGKGVGDGLVPVHVGAAGAGFCPGLRARGFRPDQL